MEMLIGIDWSEDSHVVCIMNPAGAQVSLFEIPATWQGFMGLAAEIEKLGQAPQDCLVALETAHNLLVDFLLARGYQVYVIPPSVVNSSRGRDGSSGARTDESDATLLADLLRTDRARFAPWKPDGALVCQMRAKLGLIYKLTISITRYSNRLRAVLLRAYPQPLGLFSSLTTQIGLRFLMTYPTPQAARNLTYEHFVAFCDEQGYTHPRRMPERYAHLHRLLPEAGAVMVLAYQDEIPFLAELLLTMVQQKGQEKRQVLDLFAAHSDHAIFASLPGAGDLLAPSLLVQFGDHRDRFPTPGSVQALAGTCPVTIRSGKKKIVKFRKACDRDFRRIAQQFAVASVQESAWAAAYWQEIRPHCDSKAHAYRCLANRWLKIIWTLWQQRQAYDEAYHLQQRALRRRPR